MEKSQKTAGPPAARPQSVANADFARAFQRSGDQQVRDVGAGDQQQRDHRTHENPRDRAVGRLDEAIVVGARQGADALVRLRIFEGDLLRDLRQLDVRVGPADAFGKAADKDEQTLVAAQLPFLGDLDRHPHLRREWSALKRFGEHTDDRHGIAVDPDDLADDPGIAAVTRLPQPVTQQGHALRAGSGIVGPERSSEARLNAQHLEQVRRDQGADDAFRHTRSVAEVDACRGPPGEPVECAPGGGEVPVIGVRDPHAIAPLRKVGGLDEQQVSSAFEWQLVAQNGVRQRKHGAVEADAHRQGHQDDNRHRRRLGKHAQAESHVSAPIRGQHGPASAAERATAGAPQPWVERSADLAPVPAPGPPSAEARNVLGELLVELLHGVVTQLARQDRTQQRTGQLRRLLARARHLHLASSSRPSQS